MSQLSCLSDLCLAPYILKATALIGIKRKVGGNQFRHQFATLGILLDYKYFDNSVLLKASLLHDLVEDWGDSSLDEIRYIDNDGYAVVDLILEVSMRNNETKAEYLNRILIGSNVNPKILKCADRISNLTDLHLDTHSDMNISLYLDQTMMYVVPMAQEVNLDFVKELTDLVKRRRKLTKN